MSRIQLRIPPSLSSIIDKTAADWITLELEIGKDATLGAVLAKLAAEHQEFRQAVYDPSAGRVKDEMIVVLNDTLLEPIEVAGTKLAEGDRVMLFPVYSGG